MAKVNIDKEAFVKAWVEEELSLSEMVERFGVGQHVIWNRVEKWGLKRDAETKRRVSQRCSTRKIKFDEEKLRKFYLEEKHSLKETAAEFGCSIPVVREELVKLDILRSRKESFEVITKRVLQDRYGVDNPERTPDARKHREATMEERYGTTNFWEIPEAAEKYRQTSLKNWGVDHPIKNPTNRDKQHRFVREKYGVQFYQQTEEYKQKVRDTLMRKYGVEVAAHIPGVHEKAAETLKKKYGVSNVIQLHVPKKTMEIISSKEKLETFILSQEDRTVGGISKALNFSRTPLEKRLHDYDLWHLIPNGTSHPENELRTYVKSLGVRCYKTRKEIYPLEIDVYCPESRVGFEFNGNFWHSNKSRREGTYHQEKSLKALEKNIFIYHVFEFEWDMDRGMTKFGMESLLKLQKDFDVDETEISFYVGDYPNELDTFLSIDGQKVMTLGLCKDNDKWRIYAFYNYFFTQYKYNTRIGLSCMLHAIKERWSIEEIYVELNLAKEDPRDYLLLGFEIVEIKEPKTIVINENLSVNDCGRILLKYDGLEF